MVPRRGSRNIQRFLLILFGVTSVLVSTIPLTNYTFAQEDTTDRPSQSAVVEIPTVYNVDMTFSPKIIKAKYGNVEVSIVTYAITVRDALTDLGFHDLEQLKVKPDLDFRLTSHTQIVIEELTSERRVEIEVIPFESVTVLDDTREVGTTTVIQSGREGQRKIIYEFLYSNGILVDKIPVREETILRPQNEVIAYGTKRVFREMTINGDTFTYWKKMTVYATSYDSSCAGCSTRTATGATLTKGVIAVDPNVIPLFTHMYVPGYGFGQALDVGGAVKGNKIDLGFEDLSLVQGQWSARYVEIYILD